MPRAGRTLVGPSVRYIRKCLRLEVSTGRVFWCTRPRSHFTTARLWKMWNTKFAGKEAGYTFPKTGRRFLKLNQRNYYNYAIVWVLYHGRWPTDQIDHRNCNAGDDRPRNLRLADNSQQQCNIKVKKSNKLGVKNVSKCPGGGYEVFVARKDKRIHKIFNRLEDAVVFAGEARKKLHGRFARAA